MEETSDDRSISPRLRPLRGWLLVVAFFVLLAVGFLVFGQKNKCYEASAHADPNGPGYVYDSIKTVPCGLEQ